MGGKKKAAPAKKGKKEQEPDETTEKLFRLYRKKCNEISAPISQKLNEKFAECRDEGGDLNEVFMSLVFRVDPFVGRNRMVWIESTL
jgi:hypothetical protein